MSPYIISDPHIGHDNLNKHRGFESSDDMFDLLKRNWNQKVSKREKVYILGDIAMHKKHYYRLAELNGIKEFVLGNHDLGKYSQDLSKYGKIAGAIEYKNYIMTHIPIHPSQFERFKGNIHGHLHEYNIDDERYINVSCEQLEYTPISLSVIINK